MKKILLLVLCLATLWSLAACGETGSPVASSDPDSRPQSSEPVNSQTPDSSPVPSENMPEFEALTVVDNDECRIVITGIDSDNFWGYTLKATLENKSSEKNYMFSVDSASINGVETDPLFATEVAAGKKANSEISFLDSTLDEIDGIDFSDIELSFRVYDSDDWMADPVAEETVHVYPYGEDSATIYERASQPSDIVLVDNNYITVVVTDIYEDDIWGYTLDLFLVNKSDKNIMLSVDDASINGYMADPFFAHSVAAGKCAFSSISWSDATLEENNITAVEEIEFLLRAYDEDDWLADDFANELIVLNP